MSRQVNFQFNFPPFKKAAFGKNAALIFLLKSLNQVRGRSVS